MFLSAPGTLSFSWKPDHFPLSLPADSRIPVPRGFHHHETNEWRQGNFSQVPCYREGISFSSPWQMSRLKQKPIIRLSRPGWRVPPAVPSAPLSRRRLQPPRVFNPGPFNPGLPGKKTTATLFSSLSLWERSRVRESLMTRGSLGPLRRSLRESEK